jgi:hypothetical protein
VPAVQPRERQRRFRVYKEAPGFHYGPRVESRALAPPRTAPAPLSPLLDKAGPATDEEEVLGQAFTSTTGWVVGAADDLVEEGEGEAETVEEEEKEDDEEREEA